MASAAQRALQTVKISKKGLPKEYPALRYARGCRQRYLRNSIIFRDWLKAKDKNAELRVLSQRWGLSIGRLCSIIEKVKTTGAIIPAMALEVTVLRQVKTEETLRDGQAHRSELDGQIEYYEGLRDAGETFLTVEITEDSGGKNGDLTKEKKLSINKTLVDLYAERLRSHETEGRALAQYTSRPVQEHVGKIDLQILPPDTVFKEEFDRMEKMQRVEVGAEVVEE